jgi:NAD(P)-dependent dehydrogenase (short-subunit alcohol dehydrogenase family)
MRVVSSPLALFEVRGKSALVVGATGAFGRVAAKALACAGARIVAAGANQKVLEELGTEITDMGGRFVPVARRPETLADAQRMVREGTNAFGSLDIVVMASGTNDPSPIVEMSPERCDAVITANVRGPWLVCKAAGAQMIAQGKGGKVVLLSSTRGKLGHPAGYSAYCTSKSAVDGLVRTLACEWGKHGITVNAIAPTVFRSTLTAWMFGDDPKGKATREGILARIPLGRLGEPQDLAGALLFLVSRASDFCTGQVLYVDGGYTAG